MQLNDKVAVITGAASGIGKEIARTFAQAGASVVIADRNTAAAHAAADELQSGGARAMGVGMDVTSESEVDSGVAAVIATFGRIDILVSNAGIQIVAPLDELPFEDWKRLLAIHLDGAFLTTWAVLPRWLPRKARGTACARMSSARASCAPRWSTSRFPSRRRSSGFPKTPSSGTSC